MAPETITIPKKEYKELVKKSKEFELELVGMKIEKEKAQMEKKGQKYVPKDKALAKYRWGIGTEKLESAA